MSRIIVLNGTSSAGKTTLARELQRQSEGVLLNFSIDSVLSALPAKSWEKLTTGEPAPEINYRALVTGYYAALRALADAGNDLISDNAVTTRWMTERLMQAIDGHEVLMVGVECSPETVARRELARGDRRIGLAISQCASVHRFLHYDLRVDSERMTPEAAAEFILRHLADREPSRQE